METIPLGIERLKFNDKKGNYNLRNKETQQLIQFIVRIPCNVNR